MLTENQHAYSIYESRQNTYSVNINLHVWECGLCPMWLKNVLRMLLRVGITVVHKSTILEKLMLRKQEGKLGWWLEDRKQCGERGKW